MGRVNHSLYSPVSYTHFYHWMYNILLIIICLFRSRYWENCRIYVLGKHVLLLWNSVLSISELVCNKNNNKFFLNKCISYKKLELKLLLKFGIQSNTESPFPHDRHRLIVRARSYGGCHVPSWPFPLIYVPALLLQDLPVIPYLYVLPSLWGCKLLLALVAQLYPALCDPMDFGLPGSSIHRILQARILDWVTCPSSGYFPDPGIEPGSPILEADSLLSRPPGKPKLLSRGGHFL